jgi:hypothetical protein
MFRLETAQNNALRLICGAVKTTPVTALQIYTENLPIVCKYKNKQQPPSLKNKLPPELEMIDLHYPEKDRLRVYTGGSQVVEANTAGAEVHCKLFLQYATVGVNKSNFDGEIQAITLTLQQLLDRLQAFSSKSATIKEDK